MSNKVLNVLRKDFQVEILGNPTSCNYLNGQWYLLTVNPLPQKEEIYNIISDIEKDIGVFVNKGQVTHDRLCDEEHKIKKRLEKCIPYLEDTTFKVLVYINKDFILYEQNMPIAIVIEPEISFMTYPDHPHLNFGKMYPKEKPEETLKKIFPKSKLLESMNIESPKRYYISESLCLLHDYNELGNVENDEIGYLQQTFAKISSYLFRHLVWLASRKIYGKGIWIGPTHNQFPVERFSYMIDPNNMCRCGSRLSYSLCCLDKDIRILENNLRHTINPPITYRKLYRDWKELDKSPEFIGEIKKQNIRAGWVQYRRNPHTNTLNEIRKSLDKNLGK